LSEHLEGNDVALLKWLTNILIAEM